MGACQSTGPYWHSRDIGNCEEIRGASVRDDMGIVLSNPPSGFGAHTSKHYVRDLGWESFRNCGDEIVGGNVGTFSMIGVWGSGCKLRPNPCRPLLWTQIPTCLSPVEYLLLNWV